MDGQRRSQRAAPAAAERFLPLRAHWLHVLLAIAGGHQHGYVIRQEVERRTEGRVRLWPATLYGTLSQLSAEGLLEEMGAGEAGDESEDPRRRSYRLTPLGRAVLEAETRRLEELVRVARATLRPGAPGHA